jgi:hypothetical protein
MNRVKLAISIIGYTIFLIACEKSKPNGSVLVTAKSEGKALGQAVVYLKKDTLSNPGLPLEQFDEVKRADASGQAYFDELTPGKYYFYADGYSPSAKKYVHGDGNVIVVYRTRSNTYDLIIDTAP